MYGMNGDVIFVMCKMLCCLKMMFDKVNSGNSDLIYSLSDLALFFVVD